MKDWFMIFLVSSCSNCHCSWQSVTAWYKQRTGKILACFLFCDMWCLFPQSPTKLAWVTWLAVWMEYAYTMRCVWVCALPSLGSLVHVTDCCVFVCAWGVSCEDVVFFFLCSWCGALTRPFPWKPGPEPVGLWRVSCFEALKRRLGKWVLWYTVFCCWVGLT